MENPQLFFLPLDELVGSKNEQTLYLELTEEERGTILSMLDEYECGSENSNLHEKVRFLKRYLKALLERAQNK